MSNYVFDKAESISFTRAYFPAGYKFDENPKQIEGKKLAGGQRVPDFDLPSLAGKNISLSSLAGKPAFLVFSEIGCPPCMQSIPAINDIMKKYHGISFIAIYPRDKKEFLEKMAKSKNIKYDILYNSSQTGKDYYINGYPSFFLIDSQGKLTYSSTGYGDNSEKKWEEEFNKLINEK
jgi:thiol-disulfide isomerase/thioredoxin